MCPVTVSEALALGNCFPVAAARPARPDDVAIISVGCTGIVLVHIFVLVLVLLLVLVSFSPSDGGRGRERGRGRGGLGNRRRFLQGKPRGCFRGFSRIVGSTSRMRISRWHDATTEAPMKVILRNPVTDLYFIGPQMWTNDPAKAFDFERMEKAVDLARRNGLQDAELVFLSAHVPGDLRLLISQA